MTCETGDSMYWAKLPMYGKIRFPDFFNSGIQVDFHPWNFSNCKTKYYICQTYIVLVLDGYNFLLQAKEIERTDPPRN